jgi:hypothetical protein
LGGEVKRSEDFSRTFFYVYKTRAFASQINYNATYCTLEELCCL